MPDKESKNGKNGNSRNGMRTLRSIQSIKLKSETKLDRFHVILDLYQCEDKSLAKAKLLEQRVKKVLSKFQLELKVETFYQFQPFGVTAIVGARNLQFTVHTWPEYQSAAIDLYSFMDRKTAMQVCEQLKLMFKSGEYEMKVRKR